MADMQNVVITGASTGIGAETARLLAPGNRLVLQYYSSEEEMMKVEQEIRDRDGKPAMVQADLATQAGTDALISEIRDRLERVDVLVNNAGSLIERQAADELNWDLMERTFSLNVFSLMYLTSRLYPLLREGRDPCVVNITSIAMRSGAPGATIYGASKGAVDSFTRGVAKEWAPEIRVNAVAPGVIDTPFHEKFSDPEKMEAFQEEIPLDRVGNPEEIAAAVQFVIANKFMTGETVDVNGGMFMR